MRVDYLTQVGSRDEVAGLEPLLRRSGVNLVALGAGRTEWTYFPWPGHPDDWSTDVQKTGHDYLREDSLRFGKWSHVSAVVDVLSPLYIQSHPETAAISWTGIPSTDLVSTMDLVNGQHGRDLLAMIDEIATDYPVNSVTLTELVYYGDGYGEQDQAAYSAYTGMTDWPRLPNGNVDINNPSIGTWRAYEIGQFLDQAAALVHGHGKKLFLETRIKVDSTGQVSAYNGADFAELLKHVDKLVVFGSNDPLYRDPRNTQAIARYLSGFDRSRIILGAGLWAQDYIVDTPKDQMKSITPAEFQYALEAAANGGAENLWITPSFLMSVSHWEVLDTFWARK
jgi:hypothetical protein